MICQEGAEAIEIGVQGGDEVLGQEVGRAGGVGVEGRAGDVGPVDELRDGDLRDRFAPRQAEDCVNQCAAGALVARIVLGGTHGQRPVLELIQVVGRVYARVTFANT